MVKKVDPEDTVKDSNDNKNPSKRRRRRPQELSRQQASLDLIMKDGDDTKPKPSKRRKRGVTKQAPLDRIDDDAANAKDANLPSVDLTNESDNDQQQNSIKPVATLHWKKKDVASSVKPITLTDF